MELGVEYPDRELSKSRKHGVVFQIPEAKINSQPSSPGSSPRYYRLRSGKSPDQLSQLEKQDLDPRYFRLHSGKPDDQPFLSEKPDSDPGSFRPCSAKTPNELTTLVPTNTKFIRPWTGHAFKKDLIRTRTFPRQALKKPHLRAPCRSPATSICSDASSVITAVGLETKRQSDSSSPKSPKSLSGGVQGFLSKAIVRIPPVDKDTKQKWALTLDDDTLNEVDEDEKQEPVKRSLKEHPSFETWLAGPLEDSDEYDTDLEIEDYVKIKKEERVIDSSGTAWYEEQCEKQGVTPVSYMKRHLGDKTLRMRHHYIGESGAKPVAVALTFNTVTENLDLSDNFMQGKGACYIAHMMKENNFVTSLNISRNFIGREGASAISSMLATNTTLKTLNLSGNQLTDSCAQCLVEGLKNNTSLTSLDLSNNDFGEEGGVHLGAALSLNFGLVELDLSWNAIRNKGATALINGLSVNNSLEVFDVSWNGLGLPGAGALRKALPIITRLRVLDLSNNRFNAKAGQLLAEGLSKNTGLETLVLNLNPMKDDGTEAILKAVEKHPSISLLSIEKEKNQRKLQELQIQKGIIILDGGAGGYHRLTSALSLVKLFMKFVHSNYSDLKAAFKQHDMDLSGELGGDDVKTAFREAGLRLTSKQLDVVLDEINVDCRSMVIYENILNGKLFAQYLTQRPFRVIQAKTMGMDLNGILENMNRQLTVA